LGSSNTRQFLSSFWGNSETCDVYILDNGSTSESVKEISYQGFFEEEKSLWKDIDGISYGEAEPIKVVSLEDFDTYLLGNSVPHGVTLVSSKENLGFASGNNVLIKYLQKHCAYTHYWFINNDTVLDECSVENLKESLAQVSPLDLVGTIVLYYDDPDKVQYYGGSRLYMNKGSVVGLYQNKNMLDIPTITRTPDVLTGSSMVVSRELVDKGIVFNPEYFFYWEDVDLSMRAKNHGGSIVVCNNVKVFHKEKMTIGRKSAKSEMYFTQYSILFQKYHGTIKSLITSFLYHVLRIGKRLVTFKFRHAWGNIKGLFRGILQRKQNLA